MNWLSVIDQAGHQCCTLDRLSTVLLGQRPRDIKSRPFTTSPQLSTSWSRYASFRVAAIWKNQQGAHRTRTLGITQQRHQRETTCTVDVVVEAEHLPPRKYLESWSCGITRGFLFCCWAGPTPGYWRARHQRITITTGYCICLRMGIKDSRRGPIPRIYPFREREEAPSVCRLLRVRTQPHKKEKAMLSVTM